MIIKCPNCGRRFDLQRQPPATFRCPKCSFTVPFSIVLHEQNSESKPVSTSADDMPVAGNNTVMSAWSDETGKSTFKILNETIKQGEFSRFTLTTMRVVEVTDNSAKIERHIYTNEFPSRVTPER